MHVDTIYIYRCMSSMYTQVLYFIYSDIYRKKTGRNTPNCEGWSTLDCGIIGDLIFVFYFYCLVAKFNTKYLS